MSALTPTDAASCRAMAVECGRRANQHWAFGEPGKARREIERARELTLLALKLEQEEQVSARGLKSNAESAGEVGSPPPVSPAAHSSSLPAANPQATRRPDPLPLEGSGHQFPTGAA